MVQRVVCVKCGRFLMVQKSGIVVIEMAEFGPYKLWYADTLECPKCGFRVVTRFSDGPYLSHYEDSFKRELDQVIASGNYLRARL